MVLRSVIAGHRLPEVSTGIRQDTGGATKQAEEPVGERDPHGVVLPFCYLEQARSEGGDAANLHQARAHIFRIGDPLTVFE